MDYITYDTKCIWRCYEIKVSKSDFNSKAHNTFIGHFNYYVMPKELYDAVKQDIPSHIGVYVGGTCVKNPKKQKLLEDEDILKSSMIRSLYREYEKSSKSKDKELMARLNGKINRLEKEVDYQKRQYKELANRVREKYGRNWDRE